MLEGDEGYGPTRIVLTAVGEDNVLARQVNEPRRFENMWTLACRPWVLVGAP